MFRPSGVAWISDTSAPRRARIAAVTPEVAPLAQSTTRRRPDRAPGVTEATRASAQRLSTTSSGTDLSVGPSMRPRTPHSAWTAAWTSSVSFSPPGLNSFTPLSVHELWEADTTAPAAISSRATWATAGVGATPKETTSSPPLSRPSVRARASSGLE